MDSIFSIFANNPLPVTLSVVVALACLAIFYFFVIPLFSEVKTLRKENAELRSAQQEHDDKAFKEVKRKLESLNTTLTQFNEVTTTTSSEEVLNDIRKDIAEASSALEKVVTDQTKVNQSALNEIRVAFHRITEKLNAEHLQGESTHRLLEEVMRTLRDMNDKQSQIIGALLGMNRLSDRNRSI